MGNGHNGLEVITTYRYQIGKAVGSKHEVGTSIIRSRALFSRPVVTRKNTSILQAFTKPEHKALVTAELQITRATIKI